MIDLLHEIVHVHYIFIHFLKTIEFFEFEKCNGLKKLVLLVCCLKKILAKQKQIMKNIYSAVHDRARSANNPIEQLHVFTGVLTFSHLFSFRVPLF
jgi:hypothetical protein